MIGEQLAIELNGVGLQRSQRWILRDLNWHVPQGTCAAILGPNGSGKSTLARILACHVWPSAGESIILGGRFGEANLLDIRHAIRLVQPAGPYDIDAELTAREVLFSGFFGTLGLYDPVTPAMELRTAELLRQVGLDEVADHSYATLSSGERVRSLIARALALRPKLLLLDEPTAGLDLLAREQVLATVQSLFSRPEAPTVVLITHHLEELPPATSQVLLLRQGRAIAAGHPKDVLNTQTLSLVYDCPVSLRTSHGRFYLEVHPQAWESLLRNGQRT